MQYSAIQCSTVQYSTVRYNKVQCSNSGRYLAIISSCGGREILFKLCKIREQILINTLYHPNFKPFKDNDGHYFHFFIKNTYVKLRKIY